MSQYICKFTPIFWSLLSLIFFSYNVNANHIYSTRAEQTLEQMIGASGTIERLIITGQSSDTVSKPNEGKLIYDRTNQCFAISENGATYSCLAKTGPGSSAPTDATYITQTPNATLTNEQALSLLGTGALINTTGTGVLSIYGGATCTNQFIRALNASVAATCASVSLAADVTGTLAITNGGTGQTTAGAAFNALSPMTTLGDLIYGGAAGAGTRLAGNTTTTRKFLRQTGDGVASSAPAWDTITAADVPGSALTKVDDTNVTLTLGGSPTTALLNAASITVGWTGQLAVPRGGTGSSSFTAGSIIFSDGTILTQDNTNLFWDNTNKRLGIGTTTLSGKLYVSASRTEADLSNDIPEVSISTTWNPSSTSLGSLIGTKSSVDTAGTQNLDRIIGFNSVPLHSGTGTLSSMYGIFSTPIVNPGAGPVTTLISMYFTTANKSTSTVTTMEGVRIDINKFTSGPVTNAKGLYIRSGFQGVTGTKHGIYVEDTAALNYFGGNVGIGTTGPAVKLDVVGPTTVTGSSIQVSSGDDSSAIWKGALALIHNSDTTIATGSSIGITFQPLSSTGSSFFGAAAIKAVRENSTANNQDTALTFWTRTGANNSTTNTEKMRITSSGNVGLATTSPTKTLSLGGNAAQTIWMERHTTANTAGNSLTIQAGGATVGATDKAAGDLILAPGISTGNQGGKVQIQSTLSGTSGTTDRNPVTHFQIAQGHIETLGTAPTLSAGCGTGATIVGNDNNGTITTTATGFGTCTVTFARNWTNTPQCVLNNRSSTTVTRVTSPSTTGFTVTGASGGNIVDYMCHGRV